MAATRESVARARKAALLVGAAKRVVSRVESDAPAGEIAALTLDWLRCQPDEIWDKLAELADTRPPSSATREVALALLEEEAEVHL